MATPSSLDETTPENPPEDSVDETKNPTQSPTPPASTTQPTIPPSTTQTNAPTTVEAETDMPTEAPIETEPPSTQPTPSPTMSPSIEPTTMPPTQSPTVSPIATASPTVVETSEPTTMPQTAAPSTTAQIVATEVEAASAFVFDEGGVTEPSDSDIFRLEIATSAFYIGVFSDAYENNPNTTFVTLVADVDEILYAENATPPIQVAWNFQVGFDSSSTVIPDEEEILELIYSDEETLQEYVDIYLQSGDDVWTSVTSIEFEQSAATGEIPDEDTTENDTSEEDAIQDGSFPSTQVEATFKMEFTPDTVDKEPGKDEFERLVAALDVFYTALLTQTYSEVDDTTFATVATSVSDTSFSDEDDVGLLQADLEFDLFFSQDTSNVPSSASLLSTMRESDVELLRFIQEDTAVMWEEDDAWPFVSSLTIEETLATERGKENGKDKDKDKGKGKDRR